MEIQGDTVLALARFFEPQHQDRQSLHDKAPNDAKGVSFAQKVNVAAAEENGQNLEAHHHIDNAIGGAKTRVRPPEPVGKNAILGHAIQNAVGTYDGSVYSAGENQDVPPITTNPWNTRRSIKGPAMFIASPPMRLSKKFLRTPSGMIITAKKETSEVKIML